MISLLKQFKVAMESRSDVVLRKSNALVTACYKLEVVELRALLLAVYRGLETDSFIVGNPMGRSEAKPILLQAKDFKEHFPGMNDGHIYKQMRNAFRGIMRKPISIITTLDGLETEREMPWLTQADYKKAAGSIEVTFNEKVVPHVTRLNMKYTEIRLFAAADLTSVHAIRLYEILAQWRSKGSKDIAVDWLRATLMLEDEYKSVYEFKRRVIDPAVAQINASTDLEVSYVQRKSGRIIEAFSFTVAANPKWQIGRLPLVTDADIAQHAHPGESPAQAKDRLRALRAGKQNSRVAKKKAPLQSNLPESVTAPVVQNRNDPEVKKARTEALAAALKGKLSVAARLTASDQADRDQLEALGQQRLLPESDIKCSDTTKCAQPLHRITQQGQTYHDWHCTSCDSRGRTSWD